MGISKYAADALGDVVYAQLPEPGDTLAAGDVLGREGDLNHAITLFKDPYSNVDPVIFGYGTGYIRIWIRIYSSLDPDIFDYGSGYI